MALNFPANPSDGDVYGNYTYNATKGVWSSSSIPQAYTVSETAPLNSRNGDLWFSTTNGRSYIYYEDSDSSQWIEVGGTEGAEGAVSSLDDIPDVDIASAQNGDVLVYDAATASWVPGEAGGKFTVSDTAPLNPESGDIWFRSDTGKTYIYYVDTDSSQWVEIVSNNFGNLNFSSLQDVSLSSPVNGDIAVYNGTSWQNNKLRIDYTNPAAPALTVYNGTEWIPVSSQAQSDSGLHPFFGGA